MTVIACADCAAVQRLPAPPERGYLQCYLCGGVLERNTGRSLDGALVCAMTTLILLFPANLLPLLSVRLSSGLSATTYLGAGCAVLWMQGWPVVAIVAALLGIVLPFLRFGFLVAALSAAKLNRHPRWLGRVFRYAEQLDLWAMPDVFMVGAALGYGRVAVYAPVHIGSGGWCFIGAGFMAMLTRGTLERRAFWRFLGPPSDQVPPDAIACIACGLTLPAAMEGDRCPRCAAQLHRRKPFALTRSDALIMACFILLPAANYFPASTLWEFGQSDPHTIFNAIRLLFERGYAPVGLLVFCTSMAVPVIKLVGLTWLSRSASSRSRYALRFKTRIYRAINEWGRWSYLDPFSVVIFAPLVQFDRLAHITVGGGAPAFLAGTDHLDGGRPRIRSPAPVGCRSRCQRPLAP